MNTNLKDKIKQNSVLYYWARKYERLRNKLKRPVSGKGNKVVNNGVSFNLKFDIAGNNNSIEISKGAVLSDVKIYMRGNNHILKIGGFCYFKGGSIWFEDEGCEISIGNGTTIESAHLAATENGRRIFIGDNCMFSQEIEIRTGDSHSILDLETNKRINYAEDVFIGNHVWIGAKAIVLKGVTIGDNAIIGTGSIVTKNIPNNTIAVGIPAKVVKTGTDWNRQRV